MVEIKIDNILNATEDIIVHQVNHQGVMGAGLALQIKKKYPLNFQSYVDICNKDSWERIQGFGGVSFVFEDGKIIANMFGQRYFGKQHLSPDYKAMRNGLKTISERADGRKNSNGKNYSIAIPYGLGCGLGKGNWDIVYKMIEKIFGEVTCTIYKLEN